MVKVGLITFHRAINYGAVLQTFALQKTFCDSGADCQVIDFRCSYIENNYKPFLIYKNSFFNMLKQFIKALFAYRDRKIQKEKVEYFIFNFLNISEPIDLALNSLNKKYDIFVSGSDQVFNTDITGSDAYVYFLSFVDNNKCCYSYAASFGKNFVSQDKRLEVSKALSKFRTISVREDNGTKIIKDLTGREARVDVDPTLLLNQKQWKVIESKPNGINDDYILIYNMLPTTLLYQSAVKLKKLKNLKVVFVNNKNFNLKFKYNEFTYVNNLSPQEFLWLIDHAKYVLTSSYHGTVFSVLFHKQFLSILPKGEPKNSRVSSLLQMISLENRMHTENFKIETIDERINWHEVDLLIAKSRNRSLDYINNIILNYV